MAALPCEFGLPGYSYYNWPDLYPVYVRGEAYLATHRGAEATTEFKKILAHRGLVLNEPTGVLAHLQLGALTCWQGISKRHGSLTQDFYPSGRGRCRYPGVRPGQVRVCLVATALTTCVSDGAAA